MRLITIFNNINIKRLDSSRITLQNIKVLLSYSPKEKLQPRLDAQQDLINDDSKVNNHSLLECHLRLQKYSYDNPRKLNKNQKFSETTTNADTTKLNTQYVPVPYNINFALSVYTTKLRRCYR